jgi:molecular chaperone GrpE
MPKELKPMSKPDVAPDQEAAEELPRETESARTRLLKDKVLKYKKEAEKDHSLYLRALADLDNFRKRVTREQAQDRQRMLEDILRKFLPTLDNLERALGYRGDETSPQALKDGLESIYLQLKGAMESEGLKQFDSLGEPFDPHRHEAIMMVDTEAYPPHTVAVEIEKGYLLNDQLLRPARVGVSREEPGPSEPREP